MTHRHSQAAKYGGLDFLPLRRPTLLLCLADSFACGWTHLLPLAFGWCCVAGSREQFDSRVYAVAPLRQLPYQFVRVHGGSISMGKQSNSISNMFNGVGNSLTNAVA
jgi:hypothetical protein